MSGGVAQSDQKIQKYNFVWLFKRLNNGTSEKHWNS